MKKGELKIIDFDKALEMFGNEKMAKKFIGRYEKSSLEPGMESLYNAWKKKDYEELKSISHKMKGSSR